MAEKELHALKHTNDEHCQSGEKHFHQQEHHCFICDFIISTTTSVKTTNDENVLFASFLKYTSKYVSNLSIERIDNTSSRGPPAV